MVARSACVDNMENLEFLTMIQVAKSIPIVHDVTLDGWTFDSYSRSYHTYMDLWVPLIGDDSLFCRKEGVPRALPRGKIYDFCSNYFKISVFCLLSP